ncbi:TM0106 family RecB-like putative nuclease [Leucobacter sp. CSA1]|uniref:TM0106 family RecB-like putative nuclease n=1 Tax=Leucobacter chromiisoli TaxID=2796471 RepID=A0A934Q9D3_9MICO|nr:bifunctional RecB family nuclease/DEAD/DEAH box helicase [Leucobacter chromiisoli]MBK0418957.1 TM0106 family RecB-like putative nuclease [Leucobacter chromiisoli]
MFVQGLGDGTRRLVTSASDLAAASACEFAFLRRVDAKLGRDVEVPPDDDAMLRRAARLGDAHEERTLGAYRERLGSGTVGSGGGVVEIPRPASMSAEDLRAVADRSLEALRGGADVVFQATFFEPAQAPATATGAPEIGFVGFADFLARLPDGSYEVQDAKLARRAKVTALMQLAAYAEQLERLGMPVAPEATLILGDGARSRHRIADVAPVFRARRARLHRILLERACATGSDGGFASAPPVAWGVGGVVACGRCEVCEPEVVRTRDPLLIAGIRAVQRDRLVEAGLDTIERVADALPAVVSDETAAAQGIVRSAGEAGLAVEGISQPVLERLAMQADMQVQSAGDAVPAVRVVDADALAAIPQPNAGDLFFDFEGDPLYREPGDDETARWGLDYLFGMVDVHERFTPLWAHDLDAERRALEQFLALVTRRRAQYPGMKIYHYAAYERSHLLSIAARHGACEAEVDQLLRDHVLVDLYPIVRRALRVGSRSYSIKKLEPLYMGDELRDEDGVTSGAQSVSEYAEATAQLASSDAEERAEGRRRLDAIADYNRYDCVSTLRLRDWLLARAADHGVQPYPSRPADDEDGPETELSTVGAALTMHASLAEDPRDRTAAALAGSAIDYYQREQKSFWWAHFARLVDPIEDWADTRDVMVIDEVLSGVLVDWFLPARARIERRHVRLRGEIAPGSSLKPGSRAFLLYEHPAPFPQPGAAPGARGTREVTIVERHEDGVTIEEALSGGIEQYEALPVALAPGPPPRAGTQKGAIEEWGRALAAALDRGEFPADPVVDIMRRTPPRLIGERGPVDSGGSGPGRGLVHPASDEALAAAGGDEDARTIGAVTESLRLLDRSALAVQGPPGTGKTYLAARVIRRLVERYGWHVGVVAQSHRVVENVLEGVVRAGLDSSQVGKVPQGGAPDPDAAPVYTVLRKNTHALFVGGHRAAGRGSVVGGTAWDFSNENRFPRRGLDLLVIDEAGQFSLAPTIAASVAAERLLLLGDPQQLPQVSQGSHPEPVDTSALGWLLGEHETMPDDLGYFLAETRRMRPELADVVSELAYEGRLHAHRTAALRSVEGAGPPGVVWHPVAHRANSTSSPEEAAEVVRLVRQGLGGVLREPGEPPRALGRRDLIVVAPYNAQVECVSEALAAAGLGGVRVGTVDKFQGQEAVIAIVTLAASSPEDVPRGLEFLLMRNRLNVAISRAQWAAHLVSSRHLGDGLPTSAEGLAALSGYLRLTERGS